MPAKYNWKDLMKKHDELKGEGQGRLYDRVVYLLLIKDDPHFMADCRKQKTTTAAVLDAAVDDTCAHAVDLFELMKRKKKRDAWVNGNLKAMLMEMWADIRKKAGVKNGRKHRKTATVAMYKEKEAEVVRKDSELDLLREQLKSTQARVKLLEDALDMAKQTITAKDNELKRLRAARRKGELAAV
jgi:hypothetical protein